MKVNLIPIYISIVCLFLAVIIVAHKTQKAPSQTVVKELDSESQDKIRLLGILFNDHAQKMDEAGLGDLLYIRKDWTINRLPKLEMDRQEQDEIMEKYLRLD